MNYFVNDCVKLPSSKILMNDCIKHIANGLNLFFESYKLQKRILISSSNKICQSFSLSLVNAMVNYGFNVNLLPVTTIPETIFLTGCENFPISIYFCEDENQICLYFLNSYGRISKNIKQILNENFAKRIVSKTFELGEFKYIAHSEKYLSFLRSFKPNQNDLIFLCSSGAKEILKHVMPKVKFISADFCQLNIMCRKQQKLGLKIDDTGEKLQVVSKTGKIISCDEIGVLFSKFFIKTGDKVKISSKLNSATFNELNKSGIVASLEKSNSTICEQMHKNSLSITDDGRFCVKKFSKSCDAVLNSILLLKILKLSNSTFEDLLKDYIQ